MRASRPPAQGERMRSWLLLLLVVPACEPVTSLSVELHYSADAPRMRDAETLAGARIGVARFLDSRPRDREDIHSASYIVEEQKFHVGVSFEGRTFAPAAVIVQSLLVEELRHAGLNAEPIDAELGPADSEGARVAGDRARCDLVLGGTIHELRHSTAMRRISLETGLFEGLGGKALFHMPLVAEGHAGGEGHPQQDADEFFHRTFQPVATRLVASVAEQIRKLIRAS
jgi:hypothetical protein